MADDLSAPVILVFTPEFKRNLRALAKKFRNIRSDIQPVLNQIQEGDFIGDQIPKTGDYNIYKVRIRNRDIKKGKSSGYRLIYYARIDQRVILITIYSKTEQPDISAAEIRRILKNSTY